MDPSVVIVTPESVALVFRLESDSIFKLFSLILLQPVSFSPSQAKVRVVTETLSWRPSGTLSRQWIAASKDVCFFVSNSSCYLVGLILMVTYHVTDDKRLDMC